MATVIEKIREASQIAEATHNQVIAEIVEYFKQKFNSKEFEEYLVTKCTESNTAKDRQISWSVEFWGYHEGCSPTHFYSMGQGWRNPENPEGYESYFYKGIDLRNIQKAAGAQILQVTLDKLHELGFTTKVEDQESWLKYYHKVIIISW